MAARPLSPQDAQAIATHLPPQVRNLLNGRNYTIEYTHTTGFLPNHSQIALEILSDNQGINFWVTSIAPTTRQTGRMAATGSIRWLNGKCKHNAYQQLTNNQKSLESEAVNAVYVFCLQKWIEDMDTCEVDGLPLEAALWAQTTANTHQISVSDLDMDSLKR